MVTLAGRRITDECSQWGLILTCELWRSGSATDFDSVVIGSIPITLVWDVYPKIPYIYFSLL